jgi:hypothetical protein
MVAVCDGLLRSKAEKWIDRVLTPRNVQFPIPHRDVIGK